MDERTARNFNAHKPAQMAKFLYWDRYGTQYGGVMDFWDTLTEGEKNTCRKCVKEIEEAREED